VEKRKKKKKKRKKKKGEKKEREKGKRRKISFLPVFLFFLTPYSNTKRTDKNKPYTTSWSMVERRRTGSRWERERPRLRAALSSWEREGDSISSTACTRSQSGTAPAAPSSDNGRGTSGEAGLLLNLGKSLIPVAKVLPLICFPFFWLGFPLLPFASLCFPLLPFPSLSSLFCFCFWVFTFFSVPACPLPPSCYLWNLLQKK